MTQEIESEPMPMTGVYQFPENRCMCTECGFMCYIELKAFPLTNWPKYFVASHPTHPTCPFSHKAFKVPMIQCEELPAEFFSEHVS